MSEELRVQREAVSTQREVQVGMRAGVTSEERILLGIVQPSMWHGWKDAPWCTSDLCGGDQLLLANRSQSVQLTVLVQ